MKHICEWVYWSSGAFLGRHRIYLDSDTEGTMSDGRPVKLIDGKWTYEGDKK